MSVCRWVVSKRYDPMRLCLGGGRPRTESNPRSNLGRSMTYVRLQCSTLTSTRDRQPLGSSPNHAHATEDNTPCWGESAVATRVLTQSLHLGLHSPPNRVTTCTRAAASSNYNTSGCNSGLYLTPRGCDTWLYLTPRLQLGFVPHTTGLRHVEVEPRPGERPEGSRTLELRHVEVELSFEQRPRGCGPSSSYDTLLSPRFVPRLTSVFLPHGY